MASAAELNIAVKGDDKASGMLNKLGNNAQRMGAQFQKAGVAMVAMGGAMVLALGKSVKDWAAAGDEVQKMALRTSWAAEALSEMRHVADITGTELAAFEKGTRRMSSAIIDASDGMTEYLRDFEKLGLDVAKLKAMKPEEAFWEIAYAVGGLENELEQAAIAQGIFGRSGTALLPMLAEGKDGIEALRLEAHELGIVFDQEAAEAAARLTDAFQRVGDAINGIKFAMAEALAPSIEEATIKIEGLITSVGNFISEHPGMVKAIGALAIGLIGAGGLSIALGTVIRSLHVIWPLIVKVTGAMWGFVASVAGLHTALALIGGAMVGYGIWLFQNNEKIREYNRGVQESFDILNAEMGKATQGLESDWLNAAANVLAYYDNAIAAGKKLAASDMQQYEYLKKIVAEEIDRLDILRLEQGLREQMATELAAKELANQEALVAAKEAQIAAKEAQIALQDELNQKELQMLNILHQQAESRRDFHSIGKELTEQFGLTPEGAAQKYGALSSSQQADWYRTSIDMLRRGENLREFGGMGFLDYNLGRPSGAGIQGAIERMERLLNITLEIDGKVIAEVVSDNMGEMIE